MPLPRSPFSALVLAPLLVIGLTSCGIVRDLRESAEDPDSAAAGSDEESEPEAGGAEGARSYMNALATNSGDGIEDGFQYARPGSPAHHYLEYQRDAALAYEEIDRPVEEWAVVPSGDDLQLCPPDECVTFGNFLYEDDLLSDFEVEGKPVRDNVFPGGDNVSVEGATVTVGISYSAATTDTLVVTLHVEAADDTAFTLDLPDYVAPDGTETPGAEDLWVGKDDYGPGETGVLMYQYPESEPGGHLSLTLECSEGCPDTVEEELPLT